MSRLDIRHWFVLLILVQISLKASGEPSHESSVRSPSNATGDSVNPHEECCYGRNGKLSQLESLAEQPGFEGQRDQIKGFIELAKKDGLSQEDRTWLHETLLQYFPNNQSAGENRLTPADLNNGLLAVGTAARPVTSGPTVAPGANSSPSFPRAVGSAIPLNTSLPLAPVTSGTETMDRSKMFHDAAQQAANSAYEKSFSPILGAAGADNLIPVVANAQATASSNSAALSATPKAKGGNPQPESTIPRINGEPTPLAPQTTAVAPTPSPTTPSAVNPSSSATAKPETPEPRLSLVAPTPSPTTPSAVNPSPSATTIPETPEPRLPLVAPTPVAVTPKADERPKTSTLNPDNNLPTFSSGTAPKSAPAPDFSFALEQTFNFNRPTSGPENKKELSPPGPLPLPDFYATAVPVAPVKAEGPRLLFMNPTPGLPAEPIKKSEISVAPVPAVPELKIEKISVPEIATASPFLEPLALIKNSATPKPIPQAPLKADTGVSPLVAQSGIAQPAVIPTVVLPILSEKNNEIQMGTPADRTISSPQVLQPPLAKMQGANSPVMTSSSSTANTPEASSKQEARTALSTYSGLFDEIRSILVAKKSLNSLETAALQEVPQGEPTRQLSSMEFAPTPALEPALWKVVFLEKSGKQLSLANVMIAFGSTLLLIWILLMRLRRESKAAKATQSALLPIRKNDED